MNLLTEGRPAHVAREWARACEPLTRYAVTPALVRQNLFDSPLLHAEASGWGDEGFVAIKRSAAPLYDGPDPKTAHLSLFGGRDGLAKPLDHAVATLRTEGYASLVVGQDSGHFLPGVPTDIAWMGPWLESKGFVPGSLVHDLERDLRGYESPEAPPLLGEVRNLTEGDLLALDAFLAREFPGRWRYDVTRKAQADGPGTVFGLFVEDSCEGFALLQREGCVLPIGGAVWQEDLGPGWGSLGPIGISKNLRGNGQGRAFLGAALSALRDDGARRTIIDWTGLVDFYGAHGFAVTRTYRSYRLAL